MITRWKAEGISLRVCLIPGESLVNQLEPVAVAELDAIIEVRRGIRHRRLSRPRLSKKEHKPWRFLSREGVWSSHVKDSCTSAIRTAAATAVAVTIASQVRAQLIHGDALRDFR
eukprot:GHVU01058577.1.p3 GENE.GHVU01058577.1~~GHVU01058577.1.p3  ORF type:complete len:114 (-),score=8.00 GHVU01058577.1:853-1194(-)